MKNTGSVDDIGRVLEVLRSVADNYPESSEEYKSIEMAAQILLGVNNESIRKKFRDFLKDFNSELTDKQKQHLRDFGLDECQ